MLFKTSSTYKKEIAEEFFKLLLLLGVFYIDLINNKTIKDILYHKKIITNKLKVNRTTAEQKCLYKVQYLFRGE